MDEQESNNQHKQIMDEQEQKISGSLSMHDTKPISDGWIYIANVSSGIAMGVWQQNVFAGICVFTALCALDWRIKASTQK